MAPSVVLRDFTPHAGLGGGTVVFGSMSMSLPDGKEISDVPRLQARREPKGRDYMGGQLAITSAA